MRKVNGPNELIVFAANDVPVSDWLGISQERVTRFANCTEDVQWIHVDPERARSGPYGHTIAHGFLTLALITRFWEETVEVTGFSRTINYGLDRVRFPAPLPVGGSIRATFEPEEIREVAERSANVYAGNDRV